MFILISFFNILILVKKNLILLALVLGLIGLVLFFIRPKGPLSNPQSSLIKLPKVAEPSQTLIEYTDPAGFEFSYPDNLSLEKAEIEDTKTYADLQLFSKDVDGSLTLKITDSEFNTLDEWLNSKKTASSSTPKENNLGSLKAMEIKTSDRLLLGALDQGILFTVELPLIEEEFWIKVYRKLLTDFTFVSPKRGNPQGAATSSEDIIFEGEEVVE